MGKGRVTSAPPLEVAAFRARYPALARMATPAVEVLLVDEIAAAPDDVWPYVSDTSRFGRAYGVGQMGFEEKGGQLHGHAVYGGIRHEWIEAPFQWVAGRELEQARTYHRGPPSELRAVTRLEPLADGRGTRIYLYDALIPRGSVAGWLLKLWPIGLKARFAAAVDEVRRGVGRPVELALARDPTPLGASAAARLAQARLDLRAADLDHDLIERTVRHLATVDELSAYRLQVRRLAREWGADPGGLLDVFLHATRAGLLDLSWDVICPHCRGVRDEAGTLADVGARGRCDVCAIDFDTSAEHAVEITFHIHPSIRAVERVFYCSAEPATKTHIQVQQHVGPGERRTIATALRPGRYRVRVGGVETFRLIDVAPGGATEVAIALPGGAVDAEVVGPGATLVVTNAGDAAAALIVEESTWADDALRPAHLFASQTFRDLFGEEYLAADVQLHVGEQTILFTDIVGSTRFYAEAGDAAAFVAVKAHFVGVFAAIRDHRGAVVKTIGDAVMGAFADPVDALAAAVAIHGATATGPVRLRISIERGPCIAVNLNAGMDYFGGTVNAAAKLQACAEAREIAIGPAAWGAPGVAAAAAAAGLPLAHTVLRHDALGERAVVVATVGDHASAAAKPAI